MARVFLSSTYHELIDYRQAGREAVQDAGCSLTGMESTFVAQDLPPEVYDEAGVKGCDIFVVLVGEWYGSLSDDGKTSFTELEFNVALREKKKILAFYFSDGAVGRPLTPEEKKRDLNYQTVARDAFFKRIRTGRIPIPVNNPQDFKYRLRATLMAHQEAAPEPNPNSISKPKINRMLAKICDRGNQLQEFSNALNAPERYVHIHMLYGKDQQQHGSCVERLICRKILKQQPDSEVIRVAPRRGADRVIAWPAGGSDPAPVVFRSLRQAICLAIDPEYYFKPSFDASMFVELAASRGVSYIVYRHPLAASVLDGIRDPLSLYLAFWSQVADGIKARPKQNRVQIVIFFEVTGDPAVVRPKLDSLFSPSPEDDVQPCVRIILPELTDVNRDVEIQAWWAAYHEHVLPQFRALGIAGNFPSATLPMLAVETKITEIVGL